MPIMSVIKDFKIFNDRFIQTFKYSKNLLKKILQNFFHNNQFKEKNYY